MNFFEKRRWKHLLKGCDYNLAASALIRQFKGGVIKKELTALFDAYLAKPCLDTAVAIIKYDPQFVIFFEESKPGGTFTHLTQHIGHREKTHQFFDLLERSFGSNYSAMIYMVCYTFGKGKVILIPKVIAEA